MGTNYYAHLDTCQTCGKPDDVLHIGKSSYGWPFHFRAYHWDKWDGEPSKWDKKCISDIDDWQEILEKNNVRIFDEYGVERNSKDFFDFVEVVQPKLKERIDNGDCGYLQSSDYYISPKGYEFCTREFS